MDYITIVEEILEVYNINATDFANKIDVQRSSISHILSGRNNPSLDMLIKIKNTFPELRWDYLLLGKKPMTEDEERLTKQNQSYKQEELFSPTKPTSPTLSSKMVEKMENSTPARTKKPNTEVKIIKKVIWFYDDNTFEVFESIS